LIIRVISIFNIFHLFIGLEVTEFTIIVATFWTVVSGLDDVNDCGTVGGMLGKETPSIRI
jgi:hypothetical protein